MLVGVVPTCVMEWVHPHKRVWWEDVWVRFNQVRIIRGCCEEIRVWMMSKHVLYFVSPIRNNNQNIKNEMRNKQVKSNEWKKTYLKLPSESTSTNHIHCPTGQDIHMLVHAESTVISIMLDTGSNKVTKDTHYDTPNHSLLEWQCIHLIKGKPKPN